jgi:acyl-CoA thioester hydrolase
MPSCAGSSPRARSNVPSASRASTVEADYRAPLHYPDEFDCAVRVAAVGRSSITFAYEIRRRDGVVCIVGKIVGAAVDAGGRSIPLPDDFRAALAGAV